MSSNYDLECLADIERRRALGLAPTKLERDFLIKLAHEALDSRKLIDDLIDPQNALDEE
jgi:hypothetical protein